MFLLLRTLQAAPVSLGCPTALVVWAGMSASVLFLELPLLVYLYPRLYPQLFDKRLRAHRTSAQMARSGLSSQDGGDGREHCMRVAPFGKVGDRRTRRPCR